MSTFRDQLEGAIADDNFHSDEAMAQVSIAISLKRIADALNNDGGPRGSVLWWLHQIAENGEHRS